MSGQWQLDAGEPFAFGDAASGYLLTAAPDIGDRDWSTDDAQRPRSDGILFGQDFLGASSVTFELLTTATSSAEAAAARDRFAMVWRGDQVRSRAGATAVLTAPSGRVTYGRPRRYAADSTSVAQGAVAITCDFAAASEAWYGPESQVQVALVPVETGGLLAPLASPLSTTRTADRSSSFTVDTELPAWPVFAVTGPMSAPVTVGVSGRYSIIVASDIGVGETMVIDTRPFARSILVAGRSAALDPRSDFLAETALPSGTFEAVLRGASATGTPILTLSWQATYAGYGED